jgi:Tfp pilus assembly protein PilX
MIKIKIGKIKKYQSFRKGSILALAVIGLIVLAILGLGILNVAFGVRRQAIVLKNETSAMLAAEAGYERAVFWMEQQDDVMSSLTAAGGTATGLNTFTSSNSSYDYTISRNNIPAGARVVYRIESNGHCGTSNRTVRVLVMQAVTGWDMGMCQIPTGTSSTAGVNFATGEILDIPIHINKDNTNPPNDRDIYISGTPRFLWEVEMGESEGGKYTGIMGLFEGGITFDQPDSKITDESVITAKVTSFASMALPAYNLTPTPPSFVTSKVTNPAPAVQLEFFVAGGVGKVRITNNCVVRGYTPTLNTYDYAIKPGTNGTQYRQYNVYGWHYIPTGQARTVVNLSDTYVTPSYGGSSFGLIYVNGNVIIGSAEENAAALGVPLSQLNTVQGNISIVATGNIWIANSLTVAGNHNSSDGMPADDNPNIVSMLSGIPTSTTQGVIKVIDPGRTDPASAYGGTAPTATITDGSTIIAQYEPTGLKDNATPYTNLRHLPDPEVVEAGITVGGGGWGAEYVGNRKELTPPQDNLIVRGTITERVRGVVGIVNSDGFLKNYYFDQRLLEGFIPEDMRLKGKYIPVPAGWKDYRPNN